MLLNVWELQVPAHHDQRNLHMLARCLHLIWRTVVSGLDSGIANLVKHKCVNCCVCCCTLRLEYVDGVAVLAAGLPWHGV